MLVYFLRHAEAESARGNDSLRMLTAKGLEQSNKAGAFLARYGLVPDVVISSPLVRARQTAKIVVKSVGSPGMIEAAWLSCGMSLETCLEELGAYAQMGSVMLVGHEPDFSNAISGLLGLPESDALRVRKASLTGIDLPILQAGGGCLQFFVPARLM